MEATPPSLLGVAVSGTGVSRTGTSYSLSTNGPPGLVPLLLPNRRLPPCQSRVHGVVPDSAPTSRTPTSTQSRCETSKSTGRQVPGPERRLQGTWNSRLGQERLPIVRRGRRLEPSTGGRGKSSTGSRTSTEVGTKRTTVHVPGQQKVSGPEELQGPTRSGTDRDSGTGEGLTRPQNPTPTTRTAQLPIILLLDPPTHPISPRRKGTDTSVYTEDSPPEPRVRTWVGCHLSSYLTPNRPSPSPSPPSPVPDWTVGVDVTVTVGYGVPEQVGSVAARTTPRDVPGSEATFMEPKRPECHPRTLLPPSPRPEDFWPRAVSEVHLRPHTPPGPETERGGRRVFGPQSPTFLGRSRRSRQPPTQFFVQSKPDSPPNLYNGTNSLKYLTLKLHFF